MGARERRRRSVPGSIHYYSSSALLKAERGIRMTNEAVTPYAGSTIHHSLHKGIVEHNPFTECKKSLRTLEKTKSLTDFLTGLFPFTFRVYPKKCFNRSVKYFPASFAYPTL